jgi:hypothetical protein
MALRTVIVMHKKSVLATLTAGLDIAVFLAICIQPIAQAQRDIPPNL